ncbi:MAG: acetyl-CoA carboxylase biotin carboxyl carrier protein, partial [Acidimicrobiia bacterium]
PAAPPAAPAPAAASPPAAVTPAPAGGHTVSSSSVGVFWRAPQPGAPPFVEEGAHVEAGAQLGIVEVMKLMTPVHADVAGTVAAIHTGNGERVECGTPLVTIAPD